MKWIDHLLLLGYLLGPVLPIFIVGLLFLTRRRYRTATAALFLNALWTWLCFTPAFASRLEQGLTQNYPLKEATAYPRVNAIVVLGGGNLPQPRDDERSLDSTQATTRIGFGLQLFMHSRASVILLSGGKKEALQMANILLRRNIPASAIRMETTSINTHQNALYSAKILKRENLQRILLVTSPTHMPQAAASFRHQGLIVIPAPAPDLVHMQPATKHPWLPKWSTISLTTYCLREYIALWVYRLYGWA